jgi:Proteasome stabiliser
MAARDAELDAVESALSALAFADSEKALEKVVARLLPGLLSALATTSAAARAKCIETLQHINVRLRAAPAVAMPFESVLAAAAAPGAALVTRNVAIQGGYVARCFDRHSAPGETFRPLITAGAAIAGEQNRDALMALAMKALETRVRATPSRSNLDAAFQTLLDDLPENALMTFLGYGQRAMRSKTKAVASNGELLALVRLCVEYAGLQSPARAVRVFPTLLVAAGDTSRDAVCSAGEDGLKRIDTCDVLLAQDPSLVHKLYEIFLDSAAEVALRSLVLSKGLLRATLAASCFPEVLEVVEQSVYKPGVPDRLRSLGMQFVSFVVANASNATLRENGLDLLRGMLKVIQDDTDGSPSFSPIVRGFAYTALAEILLKVPSLLAQHAQFTPELFFTAAQATKEPAQVRAAASHGLSTLAPVFSVEGKSDVAGFLRPSLLKTLRRTIENDDDIAAPARAAAVLWANVCFAFSDADARLLNIIAAADSRPDVREAAMAGLSPLRFRSLALRTDHKNELEQAPAEYFVDTDAGQGSGSSTKRLKPSNYGAGNTGDSMDVDRKAAADEPEASFPDFVQLVALAVSYADEPAGLRTQSWGAFFRFALLTLRRVAQASLSSRLSRPDAWRGASSVEVKHFLEQPGREEMQRSLNVLRGCADRFILDDGTLSGTKAERAALCVILFAADVDQALISSVYVRHVNALTQLCIRKCASGGGALVDGIAKLIGYAATALPAVELGQLLLKLSATLEPDATGRPSGRHGEDDRETACLCVGQIVSTLLECHVEPSSCSSSISRSVGAVARRFQGAVESSVRVRVAACSALATIGAKRELPLPLLVDESSAENPLPIRGVVVAGLAGILKSDKSDAKLVEAASNAIGRICVGEPRSSFKRLAIDAILVVGKDRKEDEVRFTAGESLVRAAIGFDAPPPVSLRKEEDAVEDEELPHLLYGGSTSLTFAPSVDEDGDNFSAPEGPLRLKDVLACVVEMCYSPRPHSRAGACVFLVTFLRLVGSPHSSSEKVEYMFAKDSDNIVFTAAQSTVLEMLPEAQRAFTTLLGDRSTFAQQLASRGVSLIYDMSTAEEQKELVSTLVRSLTSGKRKAATTVAGDEGGLLDINGLPVAPSDGATGTNAEGGPGSGGGAATYKELCSLASDMGQPELVYKFLDLAGHTALWNNRRGAALAGSALLGTEMAAEQLKPHIKTLVPRLYVYCYDPAEGVRTSMSAVLRSVATAGGYGTVSEAVSEHFDGVVVHCLTSMTSRQWRVREAGAGGLRDLLPSRRWNEVGHHLEQLWYVGLRAMDDIKESVRTAADRAGRALSSLSIRLCDANMSGAATASAAVSVVVPAILPAFTHSVKEVRVLATSTLAKVIRFGGDSLRPSVPDIVTSLLESATELEPQAFNYFQFHLDADQRDELETMRADAASMSSSPVVDSLERLSVLVDETIAGEVVTRLTRLSRTGVGVPTRAATARFFSSLLMTRAVVMEPHASRMMNAAMSAAQVEMNASARRAWSNAVGLAARLAPVESVASLASAIVDMSCAESAQDRALASFLALGLWRNSPETARKHSTDILPVAYMGRYEGDENAKSAAANWKEVWSEGAPSSDAGLRLYSAEITELCARRLKESQQYKVKRSAAAALGAMAGAVTNVSTSEVGNNSLATAAAALINALPGHIWDGKDAALAAIGTIASAAAKSEEGNLEGTTAIWSQVGGSQVVVTAIIRECKRGKREYRLAAIESLQHVLTGCRNDGNDYVAVILEALGQEWEQKSDADSTDVARTVWETGSDANAVDARNKARKAERGATIAAIGCLESSYPDGSNSEAAHIQKAQLAPVVAILVSLVPSGREVRTAALERLASLVPRAQPEWAQARGVDGVESVLGQVLSAACSSVADARYSGVRNAAYRTLLAVTRSIGAACVVAALDVSQREALRSALDRDSASDSLDAAALATALSGNPL